MEKEKIKSNLQKLSNHIDRVSTADLENALMRETLLFSNGGDAKITGHHYFLPMRFTHSPTESLFIRTLYDRATLDKTLFPFSSQGLYLPLLPNFDYMPDPTLFKTVLIDAHQALARPSLFHSLLSKLRKNNQSVALVNITTRLLELVNLNTFDADVFGISYADDLTAHTAQLNDLISQKGKNALFISHVRTPAQYKKIRDLAPSVTGPFVEDLLSANRYENCAFKNTCSATACRQLSQKPVDFLKSANPAYLIKSLNETLS